MGSKPIYRQRRRARHEGSEWQTLGYDSRFEYMVTLPVVEAGYTFIHQPEALEYVTSRSYTPDFKIFTKSGKDIYIETKGYWTSAERSKHKQVCEQHPDKDIRLVFMNANNKLNKDSNTTYAAWCDRYHVLWADKHIPLEWFDE